MGPVSAVKSCLRQFATFSGRASRSEFWWFSLLPFVLLRLIASLDKALPMGTVLGAIIFLALIPPWLAVGSRRLHDMGRSGWWQLLMCIPVIGFVSLYYWWVQPSMD